MTRPDAGRPRNLQLGTPADYGFELTRQLHRLAQPHLPRPCHALMDLGCGNGANTVLFVDDADRVVGVDVEESRIATARKHAAEHGLKIEYVRYDGRTLPFQDDSFDVVTFFEVLEHVHDEQRTLGEVRRVLGRGGRLIISVPNKWYLMDIHGFRFRPSFVPWNRVPLLSWLPTSVHERFGHARIYTKRRILATLTAAGFRVLHHEYAMPPFDKVGSAGPRRLLRATFQRIERTRLRVIGVRHVIAAAADPTHSDDADAVPATSAPTESVRLP